MTMNLIGLDWIELDWIEHTCTVLLIKWYSQKNKMSAIIFNVIP